MRRSPRTETTFGIRTPLHLPASRRPAPRYTLKDRVPRLELAGTPGASGGRDTAGAIPRSELIREAKRFAKQERILADAQARLLRLRSELEGRFRHNRSLEVLRRNLVEERRDRWYGRGRR